jgi:hypothetical protein
MIHDRQALQTPPDDACGTGTLLNCPMPDTPITAEPAKPRGRWFQFRLRTLLIAVVLIGSACGYVAHEARIVRERNALLSEIARLSCPTIDSFDDHASPSWIRRMLSDVNMPVFMIPKNTDREAVRQALEDGRLKSDPYAPDDPVR